MKSAKSWTLDSGQSLQLVSYFNEIYLFKNIIELGNNGSHL
jgi:hypothetical protein